MGVCVCDDGQPSPFLSIAATTTTIRCPPYSPYLPPFGIVSPLMIRFCVKPIWKIGSSQSNHRYHQDCVYSSKAAERKMVSPFYPFSLLFLSLSLSSPPMLVSDFFPPQPVHIHFLLIQQKKESPIHAESLLRLDNIIGPPCWGKTEGDNLMIRRENRIRLGDFFLYKCAFIRSGTT